MKSIPKGEGWYWQRCGRTLVFKGVNRGPDYYAYFSKESATYLNFEDQTIWAVDGLKTDSMRRIVALSLHQHPEVLEAQATPGATEWFVEMINGFRNGPLGLAEGYLYEGMPLGDRLAMFDWIEGLMGPLLYFPERYNVRHIYNGEVAPKRLKVVLAENGISCP